MQTIIQKLLNQHLTDLNPIAVGWSKGDIGTGPKSPGCFTLLHYISRGSFTLALNGTEYPVHEGQCFLIMPWYSNIAFLPDSETVDQQWVGFTGSLSHEFAALPPVFDLPEGLMPHLRDLGEIDSNTAYDLSADLFLLRSKMIPSHDHTPDYVQYVMDYVNQSYMHPSLSVESIANLMSLDRSYLSRLFKKKANQTLQNYILDVRLTEAKRCLMENSSVKEAALHSGFRDPYVFSKLFLQKTGFSPSEWKKIARQNLATHQNGFPDARKAKKQNASN